MGRRKTHPPRVIEPHVLRLPLAVTTRGGASFDPSQDRWLYRDTVRTVSIDFGAFAALSAQMLMSLKVLLIWYAENRSPSYVQNLSSRFLHFVRYMVTEGKPTVDQMTDIDLLNYKASLTPDIAWYLAPLSVMAKKWHALGLPGVTEVAMSFLIGLRIKGNPKGVAVLTMDAFRGPYTNIELESIQSALDESYRASRIAEDIYLLVWLFMALGQRPSQYAAMKVCDVMISSVPGGDISCMVNVPRAKQRNAHPRVELKTRSLVSQLGLPLHAYAQKISRRFAGILKDSTQAPLFPRKQISELSCGFEYHHTSSSLAEMLRQGLDLLNVKSERTGKRIHVAAVRFRRTFGTRAAQEGHGELVIAELLDHSDTQSVGVYVAAIPEIAARIDRAIALTMAPLAQAFKGRVIKDGSEASRCNDPSSHVIDLRIDRSASPMGSCGQHSFCGFAAPVACYTCQSFEPWLDGPHAAVLDHLLAKRAQLLNTTDIRVASINDRTILAVGEVIQLCERAKRSRD
ncbi:site-specific integrase [Variovorax sp. PAMC26660]|uniref:site-specific integrase n=1 Tax=Variovorax sp. PAMC26660 TaxID=2762322 RepID=UPI00164D64F4|nr:site-specific integrase [Variovorax sp. PAMC26660]QNK70756.1 site-specific integrase [Variovorax sp. PAMC26660]